MADLNDRMIRLEMIVGEHEKEINKLRDDKEQLIDIITTQGLLKEFAKEYHIQMREFSETLKQINTNISNLNYCIEQMKNDLNNVEKEVLTIKENDKKQDERGKFDILNFLTKDLMKYVLLALVGAILALIGLK